MNQKSEIAERYLRKGLQMNTRFENSMGTAEAHRELGFLYQEQGKRKNALEFFRESLRIFKELNANHYIREIEGNIKELLAVPNYS